MAGGGAAADGGIRWLKGPRRKNFSCTTSLSYKPVDPALPCVLLTSKAEFALGAIEKERATWGEERKCVKEASTYGKEGGIRALSGPPLVIKSRIFHTVSHKNHIYLVAYLRPTACHPVPPLRGGDEGPPPPPPSSSSSSSSSSCSSSSCSSSSLLISN
ncbi:hypothetical protein K0M31_020316 [Melipona bicolor]|uniref:Uncharacterized protein n=1 Tax=Melipona bicolor TaxID=60889 RepID=A0AA40G171_9HYME|nr:hypothetical protein K0M31_020316 [Melipona bicolor]